MTLPAPEKSAAQSGKPQAFSCQPSAISSWLLAFGCCLCELAPGGLRKIVAVPDEIEAT